MRKVRHAPQNSCPPPEPECQNVLFFGNKIFVDVISYDEEVLLHGGWGGQGGMQ